MGKNGSGKDGNRKKMPGNYEEKMLVILAEKYRKSRKDKGTNVIVRRTSIHPTELYKNYRQNDGDMEQIEAVNQAVYGCQEKGFVTFESEKFSSEIRSIFLVDEKINEVEQYLEENFHYEPIGSKKRYVEGIISLYEGRSPAAERECRRLRQSLEKGMVPQKYLQTEEILKALVFIENNEKELFLREASMLIYGDSKYLEENTLDGVCRRLRELLDRPCGEEEMEEEILKEYHIVREKPRLCIKGDVTLRIGGKELELGALREGMEFFAGDLEYLEQIRVHAAEFMTVENYTSWLRLKRPETALFYLGGYLTRSQRDFLKKIRDDNPGLSFLHFGDIDSGGFYIHEHLCRMTGIPFQMYRMSCEELRDARFGSCLRRLTGQDITRLNSLKKHETYRKTAEYMLKKNVKLEQEIISYYGCSGM